MIYFISKLIARAIQGGPKDQREEYKVRNTESVENMKRTIRENHKTSSSEQAHKQPKDK